MKLLILMISAVILNVDSARILAVFPTPSFSHQVVFQPVILELVKRGHEVVFITPDPIFPKGGRPANLTEIDMHDIAYKAWEEYTPKEYEKYIDPALDYDVVGVTKMLSHIFVNIMRVQLASEPIKKFINDKTQHFDLILVEAYQRTALVFSHFFKAPVVLLSSFGSTINNMEIAGAMIHPTRYPDGFSKKVINFSLYEKIREYYHFLIRKYIKDNFEENENEMLRVAMGPGIPKMSELTKNVDMIFLNVHPIWEFNRPVPPNVVFLGAMHIIPEKELPTDLKTYLDSSKNGVIFMSFGTNVKPEMFPPGTTDKFLKTFADLPYDILWKWPTDDIAGLPKNVKISKWLPQRDLLMHPNIKLFITQGGLQSTDETILAGVPVLGIPMMGDQWYNVDLYVDRGIGKRIDITTMTADNFKSAINEIISDKSYRDNIINLRTIMYDQKETSLERAVWWAEYVIRHKGARHLRAAGANLSWAEYYDLEIFAYLLALVVSLSVISVLIFIYAIKYVLRLYAGKKKIKTN